MGQDNDMIVESAAIFKPPTTFPVFHRGLPDCSLNRSSSLAWGIGEIAATLVVLPCLYLSIAFERITSDQRQLTYAQSPLTFPFTHPGRC